MYELIPHGTGAVHFTGSLFVVDANVDSLNEHLIEDSLQVPQAIKLSKCQTMLTIWSQRRLRVSWHQQARCGRLCLHWRNNDLQVVLGRVRFEKDLVVKHLVMDNETLNGVDDVNVRMPFEVIVKEDITTQTFMNHSLERDFYRTKATRPSLPMWF